MIERGRRSVVGIRAATLLTLAFGTAVADQIPMSAFARLPATDAVSISPDGRYLAIIKFQNDKMGVFTLDLQQPGAMRPVLGEDKDGKFRMTWCHWANDSRLVCGYRAMNKEMAVIYPVTRMVAVNADGSKVGSSAKSVGKIWLR